MKLKTKPQNAKMILMSQKLANMAHDGETHREATESLFAEVAELSDPLKFVQQYKGQMLKLFDANKNGKLDKDEILNPYFFKWILIVLLSIAFSVLANVTTTYLFEGIFDFSIAGVVIQFIAAPFIMGLMQKGMMDDYDGRLKRKDGKIAELEEKLNQEKRDRDQDNKKNELANQQLKLDHANETHQLEMAIELKRQEIEFVNKYKVAPQ